MNVSNAVLTILIGQGHTILVRYIELKQKCCLFIRKLRPKSMVKTMIILQLYLTCETQVQKGCRKYQNIVLLHLTVVENDHTRISVILLLHLVFRVDALPLNLSKQAHLW